MIKIEDLHIWIWEIEILNWISLQFEKGKNYCLLCKNWSGKSSLSAFLMWHPKYEYISWKVEINWKNLIDLSPDERSAEWIFLSFQNVPEIKWIKLWEYLRTIYNIHLKNKNPEQKDISPFIFNRFVKKYLEELHIDEKFLERDLNVGFSGWEKRKIEILQMKLIWPSYIILDEIDSGLDLDAFKSVCNMLHDLNNSENTFIIITHYFKIVEYLDIDKVYVMKDWKIFKEWGKELVEYIKENWYEDLK